MYLIAIIITVILIVLLVLSRGLESRTKRKGIWKRLDAISLLLIYIAKAIKAVFCGKKRRNNKNSAYKYNNRSGGNKFIKYFEQLCPGEDKDELIENYVVKKLSLSILVLLVGTVLAVAIRYSTINSANLITEDGEIVRNEYDAGEKEISIQAISEDYNETVNIVVYPKEYTEEELIELLPLFFEKLGEQLLGDNESFDRITGDINPVTEIEGYPFYVSWISSDAELISSGSGSVATINSPCTVIMTAMIFYEDSFYENEYVLSLVPGEDSKAGTAKSELTDILEGIEKESRNQKVWSLPREIGGKQIKWSEKVYDNSVIIWVAVVMVSVLIFFMSDRDLGKKVEDRKRVMKSKYAEIVQKMVMYICAGLTVRAAFQKIVADAEAEGDDNAIYREMRYTCRELKSGISEEEAYERFGRRVGVQEYVRMGTLLEQNIKKGSSNLLGRLKEETNSAVVERLQNFRKSGEEASTKLLAPMVMFLLVVMVMIMVPAFVTIQM